MKRPGVYQRGGTWYVRWRDARGRVRRKATTAKGAREAQALRDELVGAAARQRLGLEAAPVETRLTLRQLLDWWLAERCPAPSRELERQRLAKHVFATPLAQVQLALLRPGDFEERFVLMEKAGLAASSINRLRTTLHAAFSSARQPPARWQGANPLADVRRRQAPKHPAVTLNPGQVAKLLAVVSPYWRGVCAVAAYLGLRKGEIYALRRADYDAEAQTLRVAGSHQRSTTKGGRHDVLPVPAILRPYLDAAVRTRRLSPWLFPTKHGGQRSRESDPHLIVRRACARAGIVTQWRQWCRRCKANGVTAPVTITAVTSDGPAPEGRCPTCGMKLWASGEPPPVRFHDLRHSAATNLLRAGVPLQHAQRLLRHASIKTTVDLYGHLDLSDLRAAVELAHAPVATKDEAEGTKR